MFKRTVLVTISALGVAGGGIGSAFVATSAVTTKAPTS